MTRKSTSCTLRYVDQFLLTSECRGQGTVALSSGESELYALGALSAELIVAQASLKEMGLSFLIHAGADSSTQKYAAANIFVLGFKKRCFVRSPCSMEMWCPDDMGRDSCDWVGPPTPERARFNSPEWGGGSSPVETEPPQIVLLLLIRTSVQQFVCPQVQASVQRHSHGVPRNQRTATGTGWWGRDALHGQVPGEPTPQPEPTLSG